MKTAELTGAALDWAVAQAEKDSDEGIFYDEDYDSMGFYDHDDVFCPYQPSSSWAQGGPIIERENITVIRANSTYQERKNIPQWFAETSQWVGHAADESYEHQSMEPTFMISEDGGYYGTTPLEAAMRCYVASKLGDKIEIPEELT